MPVYLEGIAMSRIRLLALCATASTIALALPAAAQTAPAPAAAPEPDESNTVIVTGTRAVNRTVADSAVPIDVISSEALSASGLGETNKILNQLVPSFNFPQPSITDGTDVIRPASLRGLSPDQTLVLVNGKRRHVSALSTSTARSAAVRPRSISTPSRHSPSTVSRCCATALRRNMARTRSPV